MTLFLFCVVCCCYVSSDSYCTCLFETYSAYLASIHSDMTQIYDLRQHMQKVIVCQTQKQKQKTKITKQNLEDSGGTMTLFYVCWQNSLKGSSPFITFWLYLLNTYHCFQSKPSFIVPAARRKGNYEMSTVCVVVDVQGESQKCNSN